MLVSWPEQILTLLVNKIYNILNLNFVNGLNIILMTVFLQGSLSSGAGSSHHFAFWPFDWIFQVSATNLWSNSAPNLTWLRPQTLTSVLISQQRTGVTPEQVLETTGGHRSMRATGRHHLQKDEPPLGLEGPTRCLQMKRFLILGWRRTDVVMFPSVPPLTSSSWYSSVPFIVHPCLQRSCRRILGSGWCNNVLRKPPERKRLSLRILMLRLAGVSTISQRDTWHYMKYRPWRFWAELVTKVQRLVETKRNRLDLMDSTTIDTLGDTVTSLLRSKSTKLVQRATIRRETRLFLWNLRLDWLTYSR